MNGFVLILIIMSIKLQFGTTLISVSGPVSRGVPQGSALSANLFI